MTTEEENRALWLAPYLSLQARSDIRLRTVLISTAQDAEKEVIALSKSSTFSNGVRAAQLRLLITELQPVLKELFDDVIPVVGNSQKDAGVLAVNQFSKADADYLKAAIQDSGISLSDFTAGQRGAARNGIRAAISSLQKSDYDLSSNVYGTRALSNRWLKNQVAILIARGESANTIAKAVRSSVSPRTPGGVAYAAMRLGRTELNNAFHATAVDLAKDRPWVSGMDWHLSSVHSHSPNKTEICELYSKKQYKVEAVPAKPHPQCRCYVTPSLVAKEVFMRRLTAGQYRSWIHEAA